MESTQKYSESGTQLLDKARQDLINDMKSREIGAIVWDLSSVGFHYIPEVRVADKDGKERVVRVTGLYRYDGVLYLIEEDASGVSVDDYYNPDSEVKPSVVTLTEDMAGRDLGDPQGKEGFTTEGSIEEWLVVADCYFEALAEDNPPM